MKPFPKPSRMESFVDILSQCIGVLISMNLAVKIECKFLIGIFFNLREQIVIDNADFRSFDNGNIIEITEGSSIRAKDQVITNTTF